MIRSGMVRLSSVLFRTHLPHQPPQKMPFGTEVACPGRAKGEKGWRIRGETSIRIFGVNSEKDRFEKAAKQLTE